MLKRLGCTFFVALTIGGASHAQAPREPAAQTSTPSATSLRAGLAGKWAGTLGYRDYQTNKLTELSVRTAITVVPDQLTQIRTSEFDEGRERKSVWITSVSIDEPGDKRMKSASFRAGRAPELETETMSVTGYQGPTNWTITYSQTGTDGNQPSDIRVTETRDGANLLAVKEVRPVGSQQAWSFRNQTRLRRTGD